MARVDKALERGVGAWLLVGKHLTRSGKAFLIQCFCGEFFVYQLTPRQAAVMGAEPDILSSGYGVTPHHHEPRGETTVRLGEVRIELADQLMLQQSIRGRLNYSSDWTYPIPLALQVSCETVSRTSKLLYHHLGKLVAGDGVLEFSLPPIGDLDDRQGRSFRGLLPLYLQLCVVQTGGLDLLPDIAPLGTIHPEILDVLHYIEETRPRPPEKKSSIARPTGLSDRPENRTAIPSPGQPRMQRFWGLSDIRAALVEIIG